MPYKTIVVHLNDEHRAPVLLEAAIKIAAAEAAHLLGFSVLPPIIVVAGLEGEGGTVIEDHRERYRAQMARMREMFVATDGTVAGLSHEWRERDSEIDNPFGIAASIAVTEARCVGPVIAAKENPAWSLSGHLDLAEQLALGSGRPVLMVPEALPTRTIGKGVVVGWNGRREAARAVFDALPILRKAEAVHVACVDPERDDAGFELCAALARHGVRCEAIQRTSRSGNVGAALRTTIEELDADLLVMGCYGHSRLREMVLGGASHHMLRHAHVPLQLSH